jgi:hypothetical protein
MDTTVVLLTLVFLLFATWLAAFLRLFAPNAIESIRTAPPIDDVALASSAAEADAWWLLPQPTVAETELIGAAIERSSLSSSPLLRLQLLRQLRALGKDASVEALARRWGEVLQWKQQHLPAAPVGDWTNCWPAAADLTYGEWALDYVQLGIRCGRAKGGHPVKIERLGLHDPVRLEHESGQVGELQLARFYYALIESMQCALDEESLRTGQILGTYEIFDVRGFRVRQLSLTAMRFAKAVSVAL